MAQSSDRPNLRTQKTDDGVRVRLVSCTALNEQTTPPVEEQLLGLAGELGNGHLQIDLAGVHYMSSIALGMLIGLRQKLRTTGGRLTVHAPSPEIFELFDLTRLTRLLDVHKDGPPSPDAKQ